MKLIGFTIYIVVIVLAACTTIDCRANGIRIVEGEDAKIEDYPYQVAVSTSGDLFCGGSIIAPNIIVTAGHCNIQNDPARTIRAGSANRLQGGQIRQVKQGITHPLFNYDTLENDIALLILEQPLDITSTVQTISLAEENTSLDIGTVGVATGWGYIDNYSPYISEILKKVELPVIDQNVCQELQNKYIPLPITAHKICAAHLDNGKAICQGDSGGAFVVNGVLHGITSSNSGRTQCGQHYIPSVFTRVSSFRSWIRETVGV